MPRRGGPHAFIHDDGLRPAKRLRQPVEVLVMMKRIAARPVDQTDVRQPQALPIVVDRSARIGEKFRDARDRNEG